ncbi:TBC domain containing protein [Histomonas meleagridis]|uniref:TBC domain containing protein n=1 Tax=Histomonas meleagridis TaxID=135588 RepID=UPI00355AAF01|nr:TBC domain containing protein [Histomonas meleagridis]KAH0797077.1 TBC domain containing protein [Histomonas meleagridis]
MSQKRQKETLDTKQSSLDQESQHGYSSQSDSSTTSQGSDYSENSQPSPTPENAPDHIPKPNKSKKHKTKKITVVKVRYVKRVLNKRKPFKRSSSANVSPPSQPPLVSEDDPANSKFLQTDHSSDSFKVDRYGWVIDSSASKTDSKLLKEESKKEEMRESKWIEMTNNWNLYSTKYHKVVERRVIKGIPDCFRSLAWSLMLEPDVIHVGQLESIDYYYNLGVSPSDHTILVDIPRTMPKVPIFKQKSFRVSLYRVLRAYSNYDKELGYYQGNSFLAAMLMNYMDEDTVFRCFVGIMRGQKHMLRSFYLHEFEMLKKISLVWEQLLKIKYPKVYEQTKKMNLDHMLYTPTWFLAAFLNLPLDPVVKLRIFDRFLFMGTRALLSFGLAIVGLNHKVLKSGGFEKVLPLLQDPTAHSESMKNWRQIIKAYDDNMITEKEYRTAFELAKVDLIP